ncbi:MAG: 1,2-phenylacetyl-CoA epoxidase subunit PaaC [Betaproteobacteria bacterium]
MGTGMERERQLFDYLLRLGDSPLVLAQRLGEWVGKGPIIEEDMAMTNVGLDLLGQARLWLSYAGEVEGRYAVRGRDEDQLAYLRDAGGFRNLLLVEQPNGSYADTTARQFLFDAWHLLLLRALASSSDARIAEIAAKGAKEVAYHVERSGDWVIRLGDGTADSHARMQAAVDELWMYTGEMFMVDATDLALVEAGVAADARALEVPWRGHVEAVFGEATLKVPAAGFMQGGRSRGGRQGIHTEHLGHLLAEMQFLQRAYPNAQW